MAGDMNRGVLVCRCVDGTNSKPVKGALVQLSWVEAETAFGGRLPLLDTKGNKADAVSAETDEAGVATVQFQWDPTQIAWINGVMNPHIKVSAISGYNQSDKIYWTTRVGNER